MPSKLTIAVAAAVLGFAGLPAFAADIPDYGSKNFSPGGDTPSYLTHENGAAPIGIAGRAAADSGVDEAAEAAPFEARPVRSSRAGSSRHGKYASTGRSAKHHAANAKSRGHSTHVARGKTSTATRTASSHKPAAPAKAASRTAGAGKTRTAKPGKPVARHAATQPAAGARTAALAKRD